MERFRIRRGELLGILGPGFVLLADLYFVLRCRSIDDVRSMAERITDMIPAEPAPAIASAFALFMVLYVAGLLLRLMSPGVLDWWSIRMRNFLRNPRQDKEYHEFPYANWFYPEECEKERKDDSPPAVSPTPQCERDGQPATTSSPAVASAVHPPHFRKLESAVTWLGATPPPANSAVNKPSVGQNRLNWFNSFRLQVIHRSPPLAEEILFAEGLSRLVAGLAYAVLISLVVGAAVTKAGFRVWLLFFEFLPFVALWVPRWWSPKKAKKGEKTDEERQKEEKKKAKKELIGALIGLAIGGVLNVVLVPRYAGIPWVSCLTVLPTSMVLVLVFKHPGIRGESENSSVGWCLLVPCIVLVVVQALHQPFHVLSWANPGVAVNAVAFLVLLPFVRHLRNKEAHVVLHGYAIVTSEKPPESSRAE
jgi:hypothetical protein